MKNFRLTANSIGLFIAELWKLDLTKTYRVTIVQWRENRSNSQNSLYWKWMAELAKQARVNGQEFFKKYYCPDKLIDMPLGEASLVKSTTELDTGEMHHYLNKIQAWCMSEGYALTIPENSEYQQLLDKQDE
jgi:hypothetical protein